MIASGGTSRSQPGRGLSLQAATGRAAPSRLKHVGSWQQAASRLAGDSCWDKEWGWRQVLRPWDVWADWGTKETFIQVGSHCWAHPSTLGFPSWLYFDHIPKISTCIPMNFLQKTNGQLQVLQWSGAVILPTSGSSSRAQGLFSTPFPLLGLHQNV